MNTALKTYARALRFAALPLAGIGLIGLIVVACDDDSTTSNNSTDLSKLSFDTSGSIAGIDDTHCDGDGGMVIQAVNPASCGPEGGTTAPSTADGGSDYGSTHYNNTAYDDDCKYQVKWESTRILEKQDVYFEMTATTTLGNNTVVGAAPIIEAYLDPTHPAPPGSVKTATTETTPGTYVIGPVQFDAPGSWTVRFHLNENCDDTKKDSPHGHAAFFVGVP